MTNENSASESKDGKALSMQDSSLNKSIPTPQTRPSESGKSVLVKCSGIGCCEYAKFDGVICADDTCDFDTGVRKIWRLPDAIAETDAVAQGECQMVSERDATQIGSSMQNEETPLSPAWQDAASAPKDGSTILVWGKPHPVDGLRFDSNGVFTAYWDSIDSSFCLSGATWVGPFINPIMWMPTPRAPLS